MRLIHAIRSAEGGLTVIPSHEMQGYILTAQRQEQRRQALLEERRHQGLAGAKMAAKQLKQLGANKVVLFGSLLDESFHEQSDMDLAVWGLPEHLYFRAVAQLQGIMEFEVDLVEAQNAIAHVAEAIALGIEL
jgi:uncharacterized protein